MDLSVDALAVIYGFLQSDEDRLNFRKTCTVTYYFPQIVYARTNGRIPKMYIHKFADCR